jgi:hypothetical protein
MIIKYIRRSINETGKLELVFEVENYYSKLESEELQKEVEYKFDMKVLKASKSYDQVKKIWKLLTLISEKQCGKYDKDNIEMIYAGCLLRAGVKFEYMLVQREAIETLKKAFRIVIEKENREYNGKQMVLVQCFYGLSKLDKAESSKLIELVLDLAVKNDIDIREE